MKEVIIVDKASAGKRVDVFLSENLKEVTRSQIKKSIDEGLTKVNERETKSGKVLKEGDVVFFEEKEYETDVLPENIPLDIVFEDEELAVINKPQGMTVHPAVGNFTGTLVNALLYHFESVSDIGGEVRPGIVHRIDKDTSGLLVVAKTNRAHLSLAKQIASKTCKRTYLALVEGVVKADKGTIDKPIGRSTTDRKKMAINYGGKEAITHFRVKERFETATLVQFDLETGRTHQIRVHSKDMGHPIIGDKAYGFKNQRFNLEGQLLHATRLVLTHPTTGKRMEFEAPLPEHFSRILRILRGSKEA